jgi:hypothetical protein
VSLTPSLGRSNATGVAGGQGVAYCVAAVQAAPVRLGRRRALAPSTDGRNDHRADGHSAGSELQPAAWDDESVGASGERADRSRLPDEPADRFAP